MRAIAYTRVATAAQLPRARAEQRQLRDFARRVCRDRGWQLDDAAVIADEERSGYRTGGRLHKFLDDAVRGLVATPAVLVVESLTRLGRDPVGLLEIARRLGESGVGVMTMEPERYYPPAELVGGAPLGDAMRLFGMEQNRDVRSRRIRAGLDARRRREEEGRPISEAERQVRRVASRLAATFRSGLGTREALQEAVNELMRLEQEL
jgi:DNA invertase Pin-like site-specific DNA recombinase